MTQTPEERAQKARDRRKAAYAANPEPTLAASKARREANPEENKEHLKKWKAENPNYSLVYYYEHRDEILARRSARRAANPEQQAKDNARSKAWRDARKEEINARARNNPNILANVRRRKYNIDQERIEALRIEQNHSCAICHVKFEKGHPNNREVVDHDHDHPTKRVRSLLCSRCNRAAGQAKDDPALLRKIADYLDIHHAIRAADIPRAETLIQEVIAKKEEARKAAWAKKHEENLKKVSGLLPGVKRRGPQKRKSTVPASSAYADAHYHTPASPVDFRPVEQPPSATSGSS